MLADVLTQQGMVGVNINYRLAPKNTWPAAHEDLAATVHWVQQNIAHTAATPIGLGCGASPPARA